MKILGIDPGSQKLGWAITQDHNALHYGLIKPKKKPLNERLESICKELDYIFRQYQIDEVAFEKSFIQAKFANNAVPLARVQGIIIALSMQCGYKWFDYEPKLIKKAAAGTGKGSKKQVAIMVKGQFGISEALSDDVTDALAVCLCHLHRDKLNRVWGK